MMTRLVLGALVATFGAMPLTAQEAQRLDAPSPLLVAPPTPSARQEPGRSWTPLRIAKWGTLAGAAGAALYGFLESARADDVYDELEQACQTDPVNCLRRNNDGTYMDVSLEAMFQDVRRLDRNTRTALVAGQVGLGVSLVLFLLDLRNDARPPDIPYSPPRLRLTPSRDGFELGYRLDW